MATGKSRRFHTSVTTTENENMDGTISNIGKYHKQPRIGRDPVNQKWLSPGHGSTVAAYV